MPISVTHDFVSAKADGDDATKVRPGNWNAEHVVTGIDDAIADAIDDFETTVIDPIASDLDDAITDIATLNTEVFTNIPADIAAAVTSANGHSDAADITTLAAANTYSNGADVTQSAALTALIDAAEIRARRASIYVPFTPAGVDDEFDDANFSSWTAVNNGTIVPTVVEANDRASISHPGGGAAALLCAYMKTQTPATNSTIELGFTMTGLGQSFNICGLIFADGNTHGAGNQVVFYFSPQENAWAKATMTGYNAASSGVGYPCHSKVTTRIQLIRFKFQGSNNFSGWTSVDGQQWVNLTGTFSRTITPTHIGFFVTTWGGGNPQIFAPEYFRYNP